MDENKKNVPEEEEKKPTETPPEGEPKEPEKSAEKKSDEPKNEPAKAEEKEPDGKQTKAARELPRSLSLWLPLIPKTRRSFA